LTALFYTDTLNTVWRPTQVTDKRDRDDVTRERLNRIPHLDIELRYTSHVALEVIAKAEAESAEITAKANAEPAEPTQKPPHSDAREQ
jgi:hypothetical protein